MNITLGLEFFRSLLSEGLMLLAFLAVFLWMLRRGMSRGIIIALFLLLLFDLGNYYLKTTEIMTRPEIEKIEIHAKPIVFHQNPVFYRQSGLEHPYHALPAARPVIMLGDSNLVEYRDHYAYKLENAGFFLRHYGERGTSALLRLVREKDWEEFISGRPDTLRRPYQPAGGSIELLGYRPDQLLLRTTAPEPAVLYHQENHDPGWRVYVDGREAPLLDTRPYKAVKLGAGSHEVLFSYEPAWLWAVHAVLHLLILGGGGLALWLLYRWLMAGEKESG